jgi:hypothetical protein
VPLVAIGIASTRGTLLGTMRQFGRSVAGVPIDQIGASSPRFPTLIADAIAELEAYDDAEHRAVLELVREGLG